AELAEVTPDDVTAFLDECADVLELFDCDMADREAGARQADDSVVEGDRADDMALLARAVAAIPNTDTTSRETMVMMAHAIKAAAAERSIQGFRLYDKWCQQWPQGQREGEVEAVWDSVKTSRAG